MIQWPEKLKWIEGHHSKIKYLQGMVREFVGLYENLRIRAGRLPKNGLNSDHRETKIIVSLTSFPERISIAYYAVKSLMQQSVKADKIILWLAESQFPDRKLPLKFKKLTKRGLEIRFTPDDLKSHKKYYYALQEQNPDEVVITFDDDIIYEKMAIERLVKKHREFPDKIICNRGVRLRLDNNKIKRNRQNSLLNDEGLKSPSFLLVPSTGAGCLYPYGIMPVSTYDKDAIRQTAFTADDLWIWYNSLKGGIGVVKTKKLSRVLCEIKGHSSQKLSDINDSGCENDRVLQRFDFSQINLENLEQSHQ